MIVVKTQALKPLPPSGFSLVELILTIAMVSVLVSIIIMRTGSQGTAVGDLKLEADVRQLNQMVNLYKADGGSVTGLTRVGDVMEKLKNFRPENTLKSHTGPVSGRLLDARMVPVIGTGSLGKKRAVWNGARQRFEIVTTNREGAFKFEINTALSNQVGQAERRDTPGSTSPVVQFDGAAGPSWIWGAPATQAVTRIYDPTDLTGGGDNNPFNPNAAKPSSGTGGGTGGSGGTGGTGGTGGSGGTGGGTGPTPPPAPLRLPTPLVTQSGGTYPFSSFPTSVTIGANGAPLGDSVLRYRKNGGAWLTMTGGSVTVAPGDVIEAQNVAVLGVTTVTDSTVNRNEYFRLVSGFTGTVQAGLGNVVGGPNLDYSVNTSTPNQIVFTHGDPQTDLGNGEIINTGEANVIQLNTQNFSSIQPNTWFNVGNVSLLNGEIFNDTAATSVVLAINFNISNPAHTGTANIGLQLINTPNSADRTASADVVKLANPVTNLVVTIDGINYRLEVSWQNTNPTTGLVNGNDFLVFEGGTAQGRLRARFVSDR